MNSMGLATFFPFSSFHLPLPSPPSSLPYQLHTSDENDSMLALTELTYVYMCMCAYVQWFLPPVSALCTVCSWLSAISIGWVGTHGVLKYSANNYWTDQPLMEYCKHFRHCPRVFQLVLLCGDSLYPMLLWTCSNYRKTTIICKHNIDLGE